MAASEILRVVPVPPLGRLEVLDYRTRPELGPALPGARVLVPVGSRRCMGVIVDVAAQSSHGGDLKDVIAVLDALRRIHPGVPVTELPGLGHYPQIEDPGRMSEVVSMAIEGSQEQR